MSKPDCNNFEQYIREDKDNDHYYLFCNTKNYEVVFLNEAMCEHLDITLADAISKKCYDVMYGRTSPCPYCVATELDQGQFNSIDVTYPLKGIDCSCIVTLMNYNNQKILVSKYTRSDNALKELVNPKDDTLTRLINSIDKGEFVTYYQPKFAVNSNEVIGAEAFVRKIKSDDETVLTPIDFIPLYENQSIIKYLDLEILRQVCQTQSKWINQGKKIRIDVNISTKTLTEPNIADTMQKILDEFNIPSELICIGINDDKNLLKNLPLIETNVKELIASGFFMAIDNFGLEHSNISTLIKIDFNEVKFCKVLLKDIKKDEKNQLVVRNIIQMCSQIPNMTTLAMGVETKAQEQFIKALAPTFIQGYFYSHPINADEFYNKFL